MNKLFCFIAIFIICGKCEAQNLVPNGDFEQYSGCPNWYSQLDSVLFWINPMTNIPTISGTPDYLNQCAPPYPVGVPTNFFGNQPAHSGVAYCGIHPLDLTPNTSDYREYIESHLTSPLVANACYHFEMYVGLSDFCRFTTSDLGVYFTNTIISGINNYLPLPFTPQINNSTGYILNTTNWTLISGNYTATGGENYLIIGCFKDDASIDTLTILPPGNPWIYFYIDDVSLTLCTDIEEQSMNSKINIYPNPFNDKFYITVKKDELSELVLYDIVSRKLLQQSFTNSSSVNTEQLAKGIYLYEVRGKNGVIKKGKVVKE